MLKKLTPTSSTPVHQAAVVSVYTEDMCIMRHLPIKEHEEEAFCETNTLMSSCKYSKCCFVLKVIFMTSKDFYIDT